MKIVILLPDARLGGAQNVMLQLAGEFAVHHPMEFLCLAQAGELHKAETGASRFRFIINRERIGLSDVFRALHALIGIMRIKQDTVILSTGTGTNLLACTARLFAPKGASLVIREACSAKNSESRIIAVLKRLLYPVADGMIGVSDGVVAELNEMAIKNQPVASIPNPVDVARLSASASMPDKTLAAFPHSYILTVGRLVPQKNTALLIDAYALLAAEIKPHLVILGGGPLEPVLLQQIAAYGLQEKIHLLGEVANPHPWYRKASVFVLSSDWEGYPNVLIEALGHGLNTVATDCEFGPRQILDNSRYGQLVAVGDVEGLASSIRAILTGNRTFESWDSTRFTAPDIAARYLAFMESCRRG